MSLSPQAQQSIDSAAQRRQDRWDGARPLMDPRVGARTIGDLARVDVGCEAWSVARVDANEDALGGVILEVTDKVDQRTGEVVRAFLTINPFIDPHHPRAYLTVTESEVDRDGLCVAEPATLGRLIRRLARAAAGEPGHLVTPRLGRDIRNAHLLVAAVSARLL